MVPELSVFVPGHHLATGISCGAHGSYSNVACLNPIAAQRWYESMGTDMKGAMELQLRIQQFMEDYLVPFIQVRGFANQAIDKLMAVAGGWTKISPRLRWPYQWICAEEVTRIRAAGRNRLPEFFGLHHS